MSTRRMRLDLILEEQGFFSSRQAARTAVMEGVVLVNGVKVTKPGNLIKDGAKIELTGSWQPQKYVSRGGLKLERALQQFSLDPADKVCLDVGASTGGFTDCLLQSGAQFVYAVDVGYGQIAWTLRTHPRVRVIERTNARFLSRDILQGSDAEYLAPRLAVMDVSFISLLKVLPAVRECLTEESLVCALVKPQFEAGPSYVGKGGVVRSAAVHCQVLNMIVSQARQADLFAQDLTYSPLKGPNGNIEYFVLLALRQVPLLAPGKIELVVSQAAESL